MLELFLCSLLTMPAGLSLSAYRQGKRIGHGDHALFGLVRTAIRHHHLPDVHSLADHDDLYFHPSTSSATLYYRTFHHARGDRTGSGVSSTRESVSKARCFSGSTAPSRKRLLLTASRKIADTEPPAGGRPTSEAEGRFRRQIARCSRRGTISTPHANRRGATPGSCRNATSKSSRRPLRVARAASTLPPLPNSPRRCD